MPIGLWRRWDEPTVIDTNLCLANQAFDATRFSRCPQDVLRRACHPLTQRDAERATPVVGRTANLPLARTDEFCCGRTAQGRLVPSSRHNGAAAGPATPGG